MHILITGVAGDVGRVVAGYLVGRGHQVTGVTQHLCGDLDPRLDVLCTPMGSAELADRIADADAVVHLAPVEPGQPDSAGITGVVHIAHAAARGGTRLLVVNHSGGDPVLYGHAAELVSTSWGPTLVIRVAPLVGRSTDWTICRTVATLRAGGGGNAPIRLLHTDDLCRFLARAADSDRTGEVDLATAERVTLLTARRMLAPLQPSSRRIPLWQVADPMFRLAPLQRDWDFECGWSPADALADTAAALAGYRIGRTGATPVRPGLPMPTEASPPPDGSALVAAAPDTLAGEFDSRIDSRFATFSCADSSDALPGPLTPMTLDVHLAGLRGGQRATSAALGLPAELAREWDARATAVFGHRIYTGLSIAAAAGPGWTSAARVVGLAGPYGRRCAGYAAAVDGAQRGGAALAAMSDAQLDVRILLLRNQIRQGWTLTALGVVIEAALSRVARRQLPLLPHPAAMTSTSHLASETAALAGSLRNDHRLRELAMSGDLAALKSWSGGFSAMFDAAVARVGPRGPGEAELANPVVADEPEQLLAAAALAARESIPAVQDAHRSDPWSRPADSAHASRELAWDNTARATHQLRITLREVGSRLAGREIIERPDDVFYLTGDEVTGDHLPDTGELIARRRAERARLQAIILPEVIDARWTPVEHGEQAPANVMATIEAPDTAADLQSHVQA
jgi:nucleoside-diphosphate-sugar epimerase